MPQMIPDGLSPDEHWQVACKLVHPMLIRPEVHEPVRVALANAPDDPEEHVQWALNVQELVRKLEGAVRDENSRIMGLVHPWVRAVLTQGGHTRQISLMRES